MKQQFLTDTSHSILNCMSSPAPLAYLVRTKRLHVFRYCHQSKLAYGFDAFTFGSVKQKFLTDTLPTPNVYSISQHPFPHPHGILVRT